MGRWALALVLAGVVLAPGVAQAQVYHWVDQEGTVHYSTGIESVPERFCDQARAMAVPATAEREAGAPAVETTTIRFAPGAPIRSAPG